MIHYIIQTLAFQLLFLIVYDLFLKKETFFNANRAYLLVTPLLSLIIPFIQIAAIRESIPDSFVVQLPAVVIGDKADTVAAAQGYIESNWMTFKNLWMFGVVISLVFSSYKLFKIFKLKRKGNTSEIGSLTVVKLPKSNAAFTFLKTIFLGDQLSTKQQQSILLHEEVHVSQRHTWDLVFFEGLRILFWFNPLIYIYQKRMVLLQEYIADSIVAKKQSKKEYYQSLLSEVFQTEKISFINTFFNNSLIKNRIVMLQKSKSKRILQLKYLLILPLLGGMLFYTSCTQDASAQGQGVNSADLTSQTDSEILQKIAELKESIAAKGEMTKEEEEALKVLYVLTNPEGLHTKEFQEVKDKVGIPFGVIEKVPVYPGCEGLSEKESKKCFTQKITQFIINEFNHKVGGSDLSGRQRIMVHFKINREGNIVNVKAKAHDQALIDEAVRVAKKLPKMTPGEHQGKKVGVEYALPIIFEIK